MKKVVKSFVFSKIAGVLAALLVLAITIIAININANNNGCSAYKTSPEDCASLEASLANLGLLAMSGIPAFIGLIISLFVKTQRRTSNIVAGCLQLLLGVVLIGAFNFQLNAPIPDYYDSSSVYWYYKLVLAAGGVTLILSGLYLMVYSIVLEWRYKF